MPALDRDRLALHEFLAPLLDECAEDRRFALRRRRIAASPSLRTEARLESDRDAVGVDPHILLGARIGEYPVALHEARAIDEEGQSHGLSEHNHGVVAGDGVRIAGRPGNELPLVVIAKPDFAQTRSFRAAPFEALECADGPPRRTAIGPASGIDELLLRKIADRAWELHVPYSRHWLLGRCGINE